MAKSWSESGGMFTKPLSSQLEALALPLKPHLCHWMEHWDPNSGRFFTFRMLLKWKPWDAWGSVTQGPENDKI